MTNDPLDPEESPLWNDVAPDARFHASFQASLRLDRLLHINQARRPTRRRKPAVSRELGDPHARGVHGRVLAGFVCVPGRRSPESASGGGRVAGLPRPEHPAFPDDRRAAASEPGDPAGGRCVGPGRSALRRDAVPRLSRQSIPGERTQPRKSARAVRVRPEIRQSHAVRLLVVPEQSVHGGGDHARAAGDAGDQLHPATLRRPHPGAGDLQVAQYAADAGSCFGEHLSAAGRRWARGDASRYRARCAAPVPDEFRDVDAAGI